MRSALGSSWSAGVPPMPRSDALMGERSWVPRGRSWMLAADGDDLAAHVGRVVAGQEDDDVGDFPRLGAPTEQLAPAEHGQVLVRDGPVEERVLGQAG